MNALKDYEDSILIKELEKRGHQSIKITNTLFVKELISKHKIENISNTPDFVLARYLANCLENFEIGVNSRTIWYYNQPLNKINEMLNTKNLII